LRAVSSTDVADPLALARLHRRIAACTLCVDAGFLPAAAPVLSGFSDNRIMLIGQAPGVVEQVRRLPFQGRSGKILMRWLEAAGFPSEADARCSIYMTSITKCFPGKAANGGGDRRPSRAEVSLCRSHLDRQIDLIRPQVLILVGGLAHERFLPGRPLADLVGKAFDIEGRQVPPRHTGRPVLVPLPHPSGASRWLNDGANRALLEAGLKRLRLLLRPILEEERARPSSGKLR
jgi:uracil-DNA glycosylase family 4